MVRPERRTVRDLRRGNRAVLLRTLYFEGPTSRHELSGLTGLSAASVSNVTGDLIADGIIVEAGLVESDGGRPRVLLRVDPEFGYAIGVDVGETHVRVELFDLDMNERAKADYPLRPGRHDVDLVVRHILSGIDAVLAAGGVDPARVLGVGIGVPGIVESGPEALIHAQTFGWDAVPLGTLLRAGTSLPLYVDNGAKTMGQAELWFGAGRGTRHTIVALIGSGAGASIITDGIAYRGANSSAGEWGHTKIMMGGRACRCGGRGCLEAYIGAESILDRAGLSAEIADEQAVLAELVRSGGPVIDETADYLGAGLANLINLFNPERIVIGGWAGLLLGRHHLTRIRRSAADNSLTQPYGTASIVLGRLGPDAVALGAATLVVEEFLLAKTVSPGRRSAAV
ncbi:ROK family protein [Streptosporangium roseum]|uniref:Transcriptional repressor of the xylose operon n=1 Tax=Streptosporangium roseum (strain ATCC 12428 / DSM 43021 / JCM 3005 / KCTC 9067 / NCIMB 10171 / NRRL 2505 / NI 9100) TaxID=479432 RepID=D2ASC3_STRRD|nr:ROK family protein [Streptosporangium roseum]ACZ86650.1 transcriptional repressor of the xylose operon [Streptosporangium roseum DSM 43021]